MENKTQDEAEIQQAAQEIEAILKKYGLGMQPTIQVFKLPIVAAGSSSELEAMLKGEATPISVMPDPSNLTNTDGFIANPTLDDQKLADIMRPVGDEIRKK